MINSHTASIEPAWRDPTMCFIDMDALDTFAQNLAQKQMEAPSWREPVFPQEDDERFIHYLGVVNSINFCFADFATDKKFDIEYRGKIWSGAYALHAAVARALVNKYDLLDPYFLANMTYPLAEIIFSHHTTPIPMLAERVANLRDVGATLLRTGWDNFANLFKESDYYLFHNGNGIVERLTKLFVSYRDENNWEGKYVLRFSKRAQLFPMMYHGRALSSGGKLQPIRDPEHFGPVVDYQIPRILKALGILQYKLWLEKYVRDGREIQANSRAEIEIRAQTVRAVSLLLERINELRPSDNQITMVELDFALWSAGRDPSIPRSRHHYTFTTAY